jgi:hypothetical protein
MALLAGCVKKGGEAIVVRKEHRPPVELLEGEDDGAAEGETPSGAASPAESRSPQMTDEEWIVSVEMVADQRRLNIPSRRRAGRKSRKAIA